MKPGWEKLFSQALVKQLDKVPSGWKTARALAIKFNRSPSGTRAMLRYLVEKGQVETKRFRVKSGCGSSLVPHYRMK